MRMLLALLALVLFSAAAEAQPVSVVVQRDGDAFTASFTFPRAAPAWGFFRLFARRREQEIVATAELARPDPRCRP